MSRWIVFRSAISIFSAISMAIGIAIAKPSLLRAEEPSPAAVLPPCPTAVPCAVTPEYLDSIDNDSADDADEDTPPDIESRHKANTSHTAEARPLKFSVIPSTTPEETSNERRASGSSPQAQSPISSRAAIPSTASPNVSSTARMQNGDSRGGFLAASEHDPAATPPNPIGAPAPNNVVTNASAVSSATSDDPAGAHLPYGSGDSARRVNLANPLELRDAAQHAVNRAGADLARVNSNFANSIEAQNYLQASSLARAGRVALAKGDFMSAYQLANKASRIANVLVADHHSSDDPAQVKR
jgi:hypothetical protein